MENGVKFMNGDLRKNSVDDESNVQVLVNGEGDHDESLEGDDGSKSPKTALNGNAPADRIKRKAKRLTNVLSKETLNGGLLLPVSRFLKNSRKSRNGFGRGLPKKGNYL
jgi:hypothetical protein